MSKESLAINGGKPVRERPFPARFMLDEAEKSAVMALFDAALNSGNAFGYNGPPEQEYERKFAEYLGGGFADGVNSGTNAVFVSLAALDLEPFSEVIVPPITDPGGVMPVVYIGCVPVVADAAPGSYNTSAEQIAPLINERTRAILVAHIAGEPVDMDPIMELAKQHNLYVVEDCAQAHGSLYKGRKCGTIGHIAAFSTMFGKHHCTGGQGGIVFTKDEKLHFEGRRAADRGKPFGLVGAAENVRAALNCNLNDLSATIGIVQLDKLQGIVQRRRAVGERIRKALADHPLIRVSKQVPDTQSSYWFLRMTMDLEKCSVTKQEFCRALSMEGIPLNPEYRHIPCEQPWFKEQKVFGKSGFPWQCSDYKGDRNPVFKVDNAIQAALTGFNIGINESWIESDADDTIRAILKVADAYGKTEKAK